MTTITTTTNTIPNEYHFYERDYDYYYGDHNYDDNCEYFQLRLQLPLLFLLQSSTNTMTTMTSIITSTTMNTGWGRRGCWGGGGGFLWQAVPKCPPNRSVIFLANFTSSASGGLLAGTYKRTLSI